MRGIYSKIPLGEGLSYRILVLFWLWDTCTMMDRMTTRSLCWIRCTWIWGTVVLTIWSRRTTGGAYCRCQKSHFNPTVPLKYRILQSNQTKSWMCPCILVRPATGADLSEKSQPRKRIHPKCPPSLTVALPPSKFWFILFFRNMINSSADQPVGYPIYVSPLTTSFVDTHNQISRVVGPTITLEAIGGAIRSTWQNLRKHLGPSTSSNQGGCAPPTVISTARDQEERLSQGSQVGKGS